MPKGEETSSSREMRATTTTTMTTMATVTATTGRPHCTAVENMPTMRKKAKTRLIPPDGGWGWVVLSSALVVNLLIPGTVKSFGVLFVEFLNVFKASSTAASWMPALCYFLYSSLGPLSSILSTKYSYRTVTLIGGTFAAGGMMLSYFANSVVYLYVSYGLMVGIGAGLSFPPTVYIVTSYFEKLRGMANGLCMSGSAIGTIVLPPLLQYLLDCFGYRGAVLIMGAITLNTLVCGLLYHPVEQHMKVVPLDEGIDNEALTLDEPVDGKRELDKRTVDGLKLDSIPQNDDEHNDDIESGKRRDVLGASRSSTVLESVDEKASDKRERTQSQEETILKLRPDIVGKEPIAQTRDEEIRMTQICGNFTRESGALMSPEDALRKVTRFKDDGGTKRTEELPRISKDSGSNREKLDRNTCFFDLSVLKDPIYLVILISNSTSAISNTNFMILLPSYAIEEGFDRNSSALLLSIVSALDLIGRIGGASLSDIDFVPKYYYFVGGLGTSGIALALLPMATSYTMLSFFCALFGLSSGMYIGITTVILADMLGTEKLSSSYGISLFVNGVLQLIGPPICGVIFENVLSYKPIFLAFGIILILGTALWAAVPIIKRNNKKDLEAT